MTDIHIAFSILVAENDQIKKHNKDSINACAKRGLYLFCCVGLGRSSATDW